MSSVAAHIDFETRSCVDIAKRGAEAYARDASTEILCLCYSIGDGPIRRYIPGLSDRPVDLFEHVAAGLPVYAHNAPFELWIWAEIAHKRMRWPALSPAQTFCTMAMARAMSLPGALDAAARALGLPDGKDLEGRRLMMRLCKPKRNGEFTCTPAELERLADYCARDVEIERELHKRLPDLIPAERALWVLDFEINARGVPLDLASVAVLSAIVAEESEALKGRLVTATAGMLTNPRAVADIKNWLMAEGVELSKLNKDAITRALAGDVGTAAAKAVLEIRKHAGKASTAKLLAMVRSACSDARARGLLSYYGADTGRWAGRRVQTQNMPRSPKGFDGQAAIDTARELGRDGLTAWYGSAMDAVSWSLRSLIKAEDGHEFIACDYSNIEGRCLAWEAGEAWKLDAFRAYDTIIGRDAKGKELRAGPDLYVVAYSKSFNVPIPDVDDEKRQIGKVQELACIAAGEPVLTDAGLIPIELVTLRHKVWDGADFVSHDGVVCRGIKEVFGYDGLRATPDHLVFCEGFGAPVPFGDAAARRKRLVRSGSGRTPVRVGGDRFAGTALAPRVGGLLRGDAVYRLRRRQMDGASQSDERSEQGLPGVFAAEIGSDVVIEARHGHAVAVHQSEGWRVAAVRRAGDLFRVRQRSRGRDLDSTELRIGPHAGLGPDRQQRSLRPRQPAICHAVAEHAEPETLKDFGTGCDLVRNAVSTREARDSALSRRRVSERGRHRARLQGGTRQAEELARHSTPAARVRVYDLINAGPRNRFTVSGRLVHNCGYQGGRGAFASMAANYGITVIPDDAPMPENAKDILREREVLEIVRGWREAHPNVVQFWRDLDAAAIKAVKRPGTAFRAGPVAYKLSGNFLLCRLPSGRCLSYPYPSLIQVPNWDAREVLNELREVYAPAIDAIGTPACLDLAERLKTLAIRKVRDGAGELGDAITECEALAIGLGKLMDAAAPTDAKYAEHAALFNTVALRLGEALELITSEGGTREAVRCYGTDSKTRQWGPRVLYGGLLAENVTQAIARDILAEALPRLEARGYRVIMHVHDEIVCEVPAGFGSVDEMSAIMCELPAWADGLPITSAGWRGQRYRK